MCFAWNAKQNYTVDFFDGLFPQTSSCAAVVVDLYPHAPATFVWEHDKHELDPSSELGSECHYPG